MLCSASSKLKSLCVKCPRRLSKALLSQGCTTPSSCEIAVECGKWGGLDRQGALFRRNSPQNWWKLALKHELRLGMSSIVKTVVIVKMQFWGKGGWKAILSWLCCTLNYVWLSYFLWTDVHILPQGEEDLCPVYDMTKPLSREELHYFRKPVNLIQPHLFLWANPTAISARQLQGILESKRDTT